MASYVPDTKKRCIGTVYFLPFDPWVIYLLFMQIMKFTCATNEYKSQWTSEGQL